MRLKISRYGIFEILFFMATLGGCKGGFITTGEGLEYIANTCDLTTLDTAGRINVKTMCGAVCDGVANDGPALQGALNVARKQGIEVFIPPCTLRIATPVAVHDPIYVPNDAGGNTTDLTSASYSIKGSGSASKIMCATGSSQICVSLNQDTMHSQQMGIQDLVFIPPSNIRPRPIDAKNVLYIHGSNSFVWLRNVQFYGLATSSHMVWMDGSSYVDIRDVGVYGESAGPNPAKFAILQLNNVWDGRISHYRAMDNGVLDNVVYSAMGSTYYGIHAIAPQGNAQYVDPMSFFHGEDLFADEGQGIPFQIMIGPDDGETLQRRYDRVDINGFNPNVPGAAPNGTSVRVRSAERVSIRNVHVACYTGCRLMPGIVLEDAGDVLLEHTTAEFGKPLGPTQISVDALMPMTTRNVRITDCRYSSIVGNPNPAAIKVAP